MTAEVNRRRFFTTAGTGLAASVAASAPAAEASPPAIPLPDADTAKAVRERSSDRCCTPPRS